MKLQEVEGVWPAYQTVRKWTKSVDVFDKDYIIVPINEECVHNIRLAAGYGQS
jgi:Ulp1 family protease